MNFTLSSEYPYSQNTSGNTSYQTNPSATAQDAVVQNNSVQGNSMNLLTGEVIAVQGDQVQIAMEGGTVLTARLESEAALLLRSNIHSNMTFEVSQGQDSTILLKPVYTNTSTNSVVLSALTAAQLPDQADTRNLVLNLMQRGMPIDKNSLQMVHREMNTYPQAAASDIIRLHAMQVPVNESTLEQLKSYDNMTHSLTQTLQDVMEDSFQSLQSLTEGLNGENGIVGFAKQLTAYLQQMGLPEQASDTTPGQSASAEQATSAGQMQDSIQTQLQNGMQAQEIIQEQNGMQAQEIIQEQNGMQNHGIIQDQNGIPNPEIMQDQNGMQNQGILQDQDGMQNQNTMQTQTASQLARLNSLLQTLESNPHNEGVQYELLRGLKDLFQARWSLDLTDFMAKSGQDVHKSVSKLYENVRDDLEVIAKAFEQTSRGESAPKSVINAQNNLSFLNQLNQTYTYLQLPLQLSGQYKNSELYVYTNKRSLAQNEGNVSAMLHLAMDHLGQVDVYVAMQNQHVNTKFYLQDEATIDFIAEHISMLDERLQAKGYGFHAEMIEQTKRTEPTNPTMEQSPVRKNQQAPTDRLLSHISFDMRA